MIRMISAIALAAGLAFPATAPAFAQDAMTGTGVLDAQQFARAISADEAIGADLYAMETYDETAWNDTGIFAEVDPGWENVGEVEDIMISRDGQVIGLVVEVGGWLDIGDENYVVDLRDLRVVGEGDDIDFVTRMSQAQLEAMPRANEDWW